MVAGPEDRRRSRRRSARGLRCTKNPRWTAADLVSLITEIEGPKPDAALRNFVHVLAENHRLLLLPEIAAHYEALRSAVENTIDVEVVSAVALDDAAKPTKLKTALEHAAQTPGAHA